MAWKIVILLSRFGLASNILSSALSWHDISLRIPLMCFFFSGATSSGTSSTFHRHHFPHAYQSIDLLSRSSFGSIFTVCWMGAVPTFPVSYYFHNAIYIWFEFHCQCYYFLFLCCIFILSAFYFRCSFLCERIHIHYIYCYQGFGKIEVCLLLLSNSS